MKTTQISIGIFILGLCFSCLSFAQTPSQVKEIVKHYDIGKLKKLKEKFTENEAKEKRKAMQMARKKGWDTIIKLPDGTTTELEGITRNGSPIYYVPNNIDAAKSTRANYLHSGGGLGLNLDGQNMTVYFWEASGIARATHQEFDGIGGNNRYSIGDGTVNVTSHASHTAGTIIASGVDAKAKGMAPQASAIGHKSNNDKAEAAMAVLNGMLISNHSYGPKARDEFDIVLQEPEEFGAYLERAHDWDELMFDAPNYLMVVTAGNNGDDDFANDSPLGGNFSHDKLLGFSISKNNLTVANAEDADIDVDGNLVFTSIYHSSSQGPTDDLRIKPDISGNGRNVFSCNDDSDHGYASKTGTSMACPNVSGSLLLLQQHANIVSGSFIKAATLKGLALHTADDIENDGPDAISGWGLLNAKKAAETITNNGVTSKIEELTLNQGQSLTFNINSDGSNPLLASISWTDRPGPISAGLNSPNSVLVNDLDIRVSKSGTTYNPWKLTSVTTNGRGDNTVDPYERVDIDNASGAYTITVTHKGILVGGSQNFSLIVTGLEESSYCLSTGGTTDEYIKKVQLGSIDNASGASSNGYADYTTISTSLVKDQSHTITITPEWTGSSYNEGYGVWIDYNQDGDFDDSGEQVWTKDPSTNTPVNGSFTVPDTALEGATKMRVIMRYNVTPPPCGDYAYGETEDYMVEITSSSSTPLDYCLSTGGTSDEYIKRVQLGSIDNSSEASSNGYADYTAISTSLVGGQSHTITITPEWTGDSYNEGYGVWIDYNQDGDFDDSGEQVWTKNPSTNTPVSGSFTVPDTALEGATRMRVIMRYNVTPPPCGDYAYGETEDYMVEITTSTLLNYCLPTIKNSGEYIKRVQLGNIDNSSGASPNGYADYTTISTPLAKNQSHTITITPEWPVDPYDEGYGVWIDYNQDGDFDDSEEEVWINIPSTNTLVSESFTIPDTALEGATRMRIIMSYNDIPSYCGEHEYGEAEDYMVTITSAKLFLFDQDIAFKTAENKKDQFNILLYPNPVKNKLTIQVKYAKEVNYIIKNIQGKMVKTGGLFSKSIINLSHLKTGLYFIELTDGQKSIVKKFIKH